MATSENICSLVPEYGKTSEMPSNHRLVWPCLIILHVYNKSNLKACFLNVKPFQAHVKAYQIYVILSFWALCILFVKHFRALWIIIIVIIIVVVAYTYNLF